MFLNRSVPQPYPKNVIQSPRTGPNYVGLVRFLIEPFLESPETLSVDCEISYSVKRAWIRIAFDNSDKGKVFGRGGRNIQAIRTVIAAAAAAAGQSVYLDIYGNNAGGKEGTSFAEDKQERSRQGGVSQSATPKTRDKPNNLPRPVVKPRTR